MSKWTSWFRMARPAKAAMVSVAPLERQPTCASGKFQPLHKYLEDRYATIVVLKVSEIEDILGFALPVQARTDSVWWTVADPNTPTGPYAMPGNRRDGRRCRIYWRTPWSSSGCRISL